MRIRAIGLVMTLAFGVFAVVLPADAQPAGTVRRIGFLTLAAPPESSADSAARVAAFRQGLREFGWVEGQNLAIEYRWAAGRSDRLPAFAEELVRLQVELIVAGGGNVVQAVKNVTTTIPIVMSLAADVVETGLVASLARPGGNITGQSDSAIELDGKQLELLKEIVPQVTRVAILWEASGPYFVHRFRATQDAAQALGLTIQSLAVRHPDEIERLLEAAAQERIEALVVWGILYNPFGPRIAAFAATHRVPVVSGNAAAVEQHFGLLAYNVNTIDTHRSVASYVDRILKGAQPGDLPIERPRQIDLVINLKTAEALGITVPPTILYQATKVIR
jgi:putative ABC transport system substrate-binding protein